MFGGLFEISCYSLWKIVLLVDYEKMLVSMIKDADRWLIIDSPFMFVVQIKWNEKVFEGKICDDTMFFHRSNSGSYPFPFEKNTFFSIWVNGCFFCLLSNERLTHFLLRCLIFDTLWLTYTLTPVFELWSNAHMLVYRTLAVINRLKSTYFV